MSYPTPRELLNQIAGEIKDHPEQVLWEEHGTGARAADGRHVDPLHPSAVCWRRDSLLINRIGHPAMFGMASDKQEAIEGKMLMSTCQTWLTNARPWPMEPATTAHDLYMQFRLAAMMAA